MTADRWRSRLVVLVMALVPATVMPAGAAQLVVEVDGEHVSVLAEDVSLRRTLEAIAAKTGLALRLHGDLDRQVSARVNRLSLQAVLQRLLHEGYVLSDERLVVFLTAPRRADTSARAAPLGHEGALGVVTGDGRRVTASATHEAATPSVQGPAAAPDTARPSTPARTGSGLRTRSRSTVTSGVVAMPAPPAGAATAGHAGVASSTAAPQSAVAAPVTSGVVAMPAPPAGGATPVPAGGRSSTPAPQPAVAVQALEVSEANRLAAEVEAQLDEPAPAGTPDVAAIDAIARSVQRELP